MLNPLLVFSLKVWFATKPTKIQNGKWLGLEEIELVDNKYYVKKGSKEKVTVGPSEAMSKSKKNIIDPEKCN